jgi:GNAT superfamily N-acetyltransferase
MEYLVNSERRSVREATPEDLPRLMVLAKEFYEASPYNGKTLLDPNKLRRTIQVLINCESEVGTIFVAEDETGVHGMLACMGVETFFSSDQVATEVMWWITPSHRGSGMAQRLMEAYESWAKYHGYPVVQMVLLEALKGSSVDKYYTKKGYELTEKAYIKVF